MRWLAKHISKYILLCILLVCFGNVLLLAASLQDLGTPIIYYMSDAPKQLSDVIAMKENDQELEDYIPFTATGILENQNFLNSDLGNLLSAQLTYIYGSSSLVCQSSGELLDDDLEGCILSSGAAWKLFGEEDIVGGAISYNDKTYYVRGVYDDETEVVIVAAQSLAKKSNNGSIGDDNAFYNGSSYGDTGGNDKNREDDNNQLAAGLSFDKIIVKQSAEMDTAQWNECVQAFENRWGFTDNKVNCLIYQRLAAFFAMLLPIIIFIYIMAKGVGYIIVNRYRPFWLVYGIVITVIMGIVFFAICQISPSIPVDMIPSRWSDFDFWRDMITTFRNSIAHILFMNKGEIELSYFKPLASLIGYTAVTVIIFFITNYFFKLHNRNESLFLLFGTFATEIVAMYVLRNNELNHQSIDMLIFLWEYLIIGKYLLFIETSDKKEIKTVDE